MMKDLVVCEKIVAWQKSRAKEFRMNAAIDGVTFRKDEKGYVCALVEIVCPLVSLGSDCSQRILFPEIVVGFVNDKRFISWEETLFTRADLRNSSDSRQVVCPDCGVMVGFTRRLTADLFQKAGQWADGYFLEGKARYSHAGASE